MRSCATPHSLIERTGQPHRHSSPGSPHALSARSFRTCSTELSTACRRALIMTRIAKPSGASALRSADAESAAAMSCAWLEST